MYVSLLITILQQLEADPTFLKQQHFKILLALPILQSSSRLTLRPEHTIHLDNQNASTRTKSYTAIAFEDSYVRRMS